MAFKNDGTQRQEVNPGGLTDSGKSERIARYHERMKEWRSGSEFFAKERAKLDREEGLLVQVKGETFTLADGRVVPILRRISGKDAVNG